MADNEIIFKVSADTKEAQQSVDAFGGRLESAAKKIAAGVGAYLSFQAIKQGLEKSIAAANEAEISLKAFNFALEQSGKYSESASQSFQNFADQLEQTTGVQDDIILKNSALLVSLGHLSGEGLQKATTAALDLSKGMQIDLSTAFDIVTKAASGNVGMLSKYGLEVRKGATDSEKFAAALDFINSKFGGMAAGSINTFQGALSRVNNSLDKVFEEIGNKIVKDPHTIAALQMLGTAFYNLASSIKSSDVSMKSIINGFLTIGGVITDYVLAPIEKVTNFLSVAFLQSVYNILSAMNLVAIASDKMFGTNHSEKLTALVEQFRLARNMMAEDAVSGATTVSDAYSESIDKTKTKLNELAAEIDKSKTKHKELAEAGKDASRSVEANMGAALSNAIATGVKKMAKNLAEGKSIFDNFGTMVVNIIGEMAIQLGTVFLSTGIGMLALGSMNPFAAIAAGIGLIAVGTILASIGGGQGSAGASSEVGSSPSNPSYTSSSETMTQEQDRIVPQTGVQVVVQGNIFDSKETGLQIAQILNDSFDLNGTLIRANA